MTHDDRMRVARVATRLNVGGPTRHIGSLMRGLDPKRFSQTLYVGAAEEGEGEGVLFSTVDAIRVPGLGRAVRPFADRAAFRFLKRAFAELRPHVVHTHQGKAGAIGRFAARAAGAPVVVHTHHGLTFDGYFGAFGRAAYRLIEGAAARRSDALVVQAEDQARDLIARLGSVAEDRVVLIPPGVETAAFSAPPRPVRPDARRTIVVPARLTAIKDPHLALDVLALLPPTFEMRFFGDGPLAASVRSRVERDPRLAGRAAVAPPVTDVAGIYADADVVLLTSRSEGTPLSLIEAQLCGTPVVAPDVGAVRSVVHRDGGAAPPRSAAALAEAVRNWSDRRVPVEAVADLRTRFDASRLCADVARLYEELLKKRRRA